MDIAEQLLMNVYILPAIGERLTPAPTKNGKALPQSPEPKTQEDGSGTTDLGKANDGGLTR
jgi:hypothetical protein